MKHYTLSNIVRAGAWGLIAGVSAGFAVGLLLAPGEGRKLRRRLVYQLETLANRIGSVVEDFSSPEGDSEARRTGNRLVEDAEEEARRIRNEIDALLGDARGASSPSSEEER